MFHKYESYSELKKTRRGGCWFMAYLLCTTKSNCVENKYGHWRGKKKSTLDSFASPPYFEALQRQAMWSTSGMDVGIIQMSLGGSSPVLGSWSGKERQPAHCVHGTVLCTTSTFQSSSAWVSQQAWWNMSHLSHVECILHVSVPGSVFHSLWEGGREGRGVVAGFSLAG